MSATDHLTCMVCMEVATNAVESNCCTVVFCEQCATGKWLCPRCNIRLVVTPNKLARKMVNTIPVKCGCGIDVSRQNLKEHQIYCPHAILKCTHNSCTFKGKSESFLLHLQREHKRDLIEMFTKTKIVSPPGVRRNVRRRRSPSPYTRWCPTPPYLPSSPCYVPSSPRYAPSSPCYPYNN